MRTDQVVGVELANSGWIRVLVLFFGLLFYPNYTTSFFPNSSFASTLATVGFFALGALIMLANLERLRLDVGHLLFAAMAMTMILATYINNGPIVNAASSGLKWFLIYCVVNLACRIDFRALVRSAFVVLLAYFLINAIIMLGMVSEMPKGYIGYANGYSVANLWYLGHRNSLRDYFYPLICMALLLTVVYKKASKGRLIVAALLFLSSVAILLFVDSKTSALVLLFCGALYFLMRIFSLKKPYPWILLAVSSLAFLAVMSMEIFADLFESITQLIGRDLTFSGRTILWSQALDIIASHPFAGIGFTFSPDLLLNGWSASHPHNATLEIALFYGIGAVAIAVLTLALCADSLKSASLQSASQILTITVFAFMICGIFGSLSSPGFVLILSVSLCLRYVQIQEQEGLTHGV